MEFETEMFRRIGYAWNRDDLRLDIGLGGATFKSIQNFDYVASFHLQESTEPAAFVLKSHGYHLLQSSTNQVIYKYKYRFTIIQATKF